MPCWVNHHHAGQRNVSGDDELPSTLLDHRSADDRVPGAGWDCASNGLRDLSLTPLAVIPSRRALDKICLTKPLGGIKETI
jgi:hypothetical protein